MPRRKSGERPPAQSDPQQRLSEYHRKRSFDKTPEPRGRTSTGRRTTKRTPAKRSASARQRGATSSGQDARQESRFVVQEHQARRLHWDLRLEHDGVLVSWALPRGFPDDPTRNRLAVHTEDHPLEYLDFEGTIPRGEYGAGSMSIWDTGTYHAEKFTDREVIVTFEGGRVTGRYALFHTRDNDWLIHRMDPPPPADPIPDDLSPMLATQAARVPRDDASWAYEVNWKGLRALAYTEPGWLRLVDGEGNEITQQYPETRELTRQLGARKTVLDGELVVLDKDGRPNTERLQHRMRFTTESEIRRQQRMSPVTYVIFDLLYLDGTSLLTTPYVERRRALDDLGLRGKRWHTPAYQPGDGSAFLAASREHGLDGIIAKRLDSTYQPGPSRDWRSIPANPRRRQQSGAVGKTRRRD